MKLPAATRRFLISLVKHAHGGSSLRETSPATQTGSHWKILQPCCSETSSKKTFQWPTGKPMARNSVFQQKWKVFVRDIKKWVKLLFLRSIIFVGLEEILEVFNGTFGTSSRALLENLILLMLWPTRRAIAALKIFSVEPRRPHRGKVEYEPWRWVRWVMRPMTRLWRPQREHWHDKRRVAAQIWIVVRAWNTLWRWLVRVMDAL